MLIEAEGTGTINIGELGAAATRRAAGFGAAQYMRVGEASKNIKDVVTGAASIISGAIIEE